MAEGADHPPQAYILAEKSVNAYALLKKSTSFLLKIVSVVGKIAALPPLYRSSHCAPGPRHRAATGIAGAIAPPFFQR